MDNVTIAVFNPLKQMDATGLTILTVGSSRTFIFEGGPAPWIHEPSAYNVGLIEAANPIVERKVGGGGDTSVFVKIYCMKIGEQDVTVEVGNRPTKTNPHPAVSKAVVHVICAEPYSLKIKVVSALFIFSATKKL